MLKDTVTSMRERMSRDSHTELRTQLNRSCRVTLLGGNLTANAKSETSGVCARVYRGGVYGFSSMADCSAEAAAAVLRAADENARFMDRRAPGGKGALPVIGEKFFPVTDGVGDPDQKLYADFAKAVDAYIAEKYPNLASRAVIATADSMEKILVTSDGAGGYTAIPRSYIYIFLNSETTAGTPIELFRSVGGSGTFDANFTDPAKLFPVVDSLYEQIMRKREGIYAEAGLKTCILSGELTGMLAHEAVGHTVEADLVLGGSVAAHHLGKVVASEKVNLVDFAHTALGEAAPLPVYLDDEGTPATDAEIIKDGVLVGYMNSRESAAHFGMTPCGNARAYAFSDEPLIRMRNTAVLPGKDKLEDMIASVEDGYYFTSTNNGQADTTGEFMFGVCMGYEIKNGKLGRAILDTTISGVAFEMLQTVDMVSDKMHWTSSGFCGKKQPMPVGCGGSDIRCRITVGGR